MKNRFLILVAFVFIMSLGFSNYANSDTCSNTELDNKTLTDVPCEGPEENKQKRCKYKEGKCCDARDATSCETPLPL